MYLKLQKEQQVKKYWTETAPFLVAYASHMHCSFVETIQDVQQASNAPAHRTFVTTMIPTVLKLVDFCNSDIRQFLEKMM